MDALDLLDHDEAETDDEPLSEPTLFVCDAETDGKICGASFATNAALNGHKQGKHRDRSGDAKRGEAKAKPDKQPTQKKAGAAEAKTAAGKTAGAPTNRTSTYTQSISMIGLGAFLAVPGFDHFDLDVVNKGAHPLAAALEAVGDQNKTVRQACDLALGGGTGGAYVQLVMAALSIGAPIAAHHGWLPNTAGERFGQMIGVMPEPVPPSPERHRPPDPTDDGGTPGDVVVIDPHTMTDDDWMNLILGIPPHVFANLAGRMMGGEGAIGVPIPGTAGTEPYDIPDDRGPAFAIPTEEGSTERAEDPVGGVV